jgi:hypothetical protein
MPVVGQRTLAVICPDGKVEVLPDCVTTVEAAALLECSIRSVQAMCDEGVLVEGAEWRKVFTQGARGQYRISREAVLRLRTAEVRREA